MQYYLIVTAFLSFSCTSAYNITDNVFIMANKFKLGNKVFEDMGMTCFRETFQRDGIVFAYQALLRNRNKFSFQIWKKINNETSKSISKFTVKATYLEKPSQFYYKWAGKKCIRVKAGDHFCVSSNTKDSALSFQDPGNTYSLTFYNKVYNLNDVSNLDKMPLLKTFPFAVYMDIGSHASLKVFSDTEIECPDTKIPFKKEITTTPVVTVSYTPPPPGATGATGRRGPEGATGPRGDKGERGRDGNKGKDGRKGRNGENGRRGSTGRSGDKGDTGRQGSSGEAGSTGVQGNTGAVGVMGPAGRDGKDSGSVVKKGGFWDGGNVVKYLSIWLMMLTVIMVIVFGLVILTLSRKHKCKAPTNINYPLPYDLPSPGKGYTNHGSADNGEGVAAGVTGESAHPDWMNSLRTEEVTDYDIARVTGVSTSRKDNTLTVPGHSTGTLDSEYANIGARSITFEDETKSYGDELLY